MGSSAGREDWITIVGLSLIFAATYAIVCAVNGKVPVTDTDVPSRLFSMGGVFGVERPIIEVVWRTTCAGLYGVGALGVCDFFYARHTKARYFALHVIANIWISLLCLPDVILILTDPLHALSQSNSCNHWPTSIVFSIHVYHMVFFRNLQWIDWLHHALMVIIGAPLMITGEVGPLMNFNNFFMCGVPGGTDYAMLFAVKHGYMDPLTEKRYNSAINVWVREPALVGVAVLGWLQVHLQPGVLGYLSVIRIFLCALATWNGLFFMERVVGNYHVCAYKAKVAAGGERSPSKKGVAPPPSAYETEEHLAVGLPGMGMRISVSTQDLTEIKRDRSISDAKGMRAPQREDAYPVLHKRSVSVGEEIFSNNGSKLKVG